MNDAEKGQSEPDTHPDEGEADKHEKSTLAINSLTKELARQRCEAGATERDKSCREYVGIILVALTLAATGYGDYIFHQTLIQTHADNIDQMERAYPPKLRFVNASAIEEGRVNEPLGLKVRDQISGEIQFLETGTQSATIIDPPICIVFWWPSKQPLPMIRPYMDETTLRKNSCGGDPFKVVPNRGGVVKKGSVMNPGDFAKWTFKTVVPAKGQALYLLGFVKFSDHQTPSRYSLFARRYDPGLGRFVTVDNPDYEREDEKALDK